MDGIMFDIIFVYPVRFFRIEIMRRKTRPVMVRDVQIGGDAPVAVQSMTKTDTTDVDGTIKQIEEMTEAGCEIVRIAVPDDDAAAALHKIRKLTDVPIVADIHFHYKLALKALDAGIDKLRLNPGNIGSIDRVREVVRATEARKIPIRIGVNGGSLEKDLYCKNTARQRPKRWSNRECVTSAFWKIWDFPTS